MPKFICLECDNEVTVNEILCSDCVAKEKMNATDLFQFGKIAYDAYKKFSKGISLVSGAVLPEWDDLSHDIKEAWCQSAQSIIEEYKDHLSEIISR